MKKNPQKSGSASFPRAVKLGNEAGQSQRALNVRANCEDPSASLPMASHHRQNSLFATLKFRFQYAIIRFNLSTFQFKSSISQFEH